MKLSLPPSGPYLSWVDTFLMIMSIQLIKRQQLEEAYHDQKFKHESIVTREDSQEKQYYTYFWEQIGDVSGLKVLDFGCGNGWVSIKLAKEGAEKVWGIDISGELIKKGNTWAISEGLSSRIELTKMAGEALSFSENLFDLVLGSAILHHTDLDLAIKNIYRVLKPGGRAVFVEPLNQNFFLKLWRKLTPWRRSPTERALVEDDLRFIRSVFPNAKFTFFGFTSIFTEGLMIAFGGKRIISNFNKILFRVDSFFLKMFPSIGKYCAVVVTELTK